MEALATQLSAWLARALWDGTLAFGLTWLLCRTALRRAAPALQALLWAGVLLKFALPVRFGLPAPAATRLLALAPSPAAALAAPQPQPAPGLALGVAGLWALGATLAGLRLGLGALRTARRVRALPPASPPLRARVAQAARRAGLERRLEVRALPPSGVPSLVGLLRPRLLVPEGPGAPGDALDLALLHELAHLWRRDAWLRLGALGVQALFFFWPPVRWAVRALADCCEAACDARALRWSGAEPRAYAEALLAFQQAARGSPVPGLAVVSGSSQLERRVDMVMDKRSVSWVLRLGVALAWGALAWASPGAAVAKDVPRGDKVLVAAQDLAAGAVVTEASLVLKPAPAQRDADLVTDDRASYVMGQVTHVAVKAGEPVRWSDFAPPAAQAAAPSTQQAPAIIEADIPLGVGYQKVLEQPGLTRVALGDPEVVDASVLSGGQVLLVGKRPGKTTLLVWVGAERHAYIIRVK